MCLKFDLSEQAIVWHEKASEFLNQYKIIPNSICHVVAYEYSSGRNTELNNRIEERISSDKLLDAHFMRDVFNDFCSKDLENEAGEYMSELQELLTLLLGEVSSSGVENFGKILKHQSEALNNTKDLAGIKQVTQTLLRATSQAIADNASMQKNIEAAQENAKRLEAEIAELKEIASRDGLTGLFNRKALNDKLSELIDVSVESDSPLSLLMFDIDHFKSFNDSFGHVIGDEVIKRVSNTMQKVAREHDFPARYGGEEFTMLLPNTPIDKAIEIAREVHEGVEKLTLVRRVSKEALPKVTISLGAAMLRSDDNSESLICRADKALYQAKETGRNRIVSEIELVA